MLSNNFNLVSIRASLKILHILTKRHTNLNSPHPGVSVDVRTFSVRQRNDVTFYVLAHLRSDNQVMLKYQNHF